MWRIGPNKVSIHAPARGATVVAGEVAAELGVSIHAPARGATCRGLCARGLPHVSIHAPARGATNPELDTQGAWHVSIHAPARGATLAGRQARPAAAPVSIHAPARGATGADLEQEVDEKFQSTRPHGARLRRAIHGDERDRFNPRARTGRDGMLITQPHHCKKSFAIANLRALSRKNGKDHDRRSDASTKTTACRNANLRGGQRSLGVRGTRAGAANCGRGTR